MKTDLWYIYIMECADGTLYTGITTDIKRRTSEHNTSDKKGSRYTRIRRPVKPVYFEITEDGRGEATRRERALKKMGTTRRCKLIDIFLKEGQNSKLLGRLLK